ncbi:MAG TPA: penicillin-binding protein activator, partial [Kofleriaceae bacterium]|nr:penicillin-binding protein activator [Kofleriaceae bacterium]
MLFLAATAALVGCHHQRKTLVPDVPQNGDATARARFIEARATFQRDGSGAKDFREIVDRFPNDPIVPWAELYAGMASIKARQYDEADKALAHVIEVNADPGLVQRAQLFEGITKNYRGDAAGAVALLTKSEKAVENDDERTEYLAALAYAGSTVAPLQSFRVFDELYGRVTPTERAAIVGRLEDIVAAADINLLGRSFDGLDHKGPSFAIVASKLAVAAEQMGNGEMAARLRDEAMPARAAIGLPKTIPSTGVVATTGSGDPSLVGAVVPLGGKANAIGEAAVTGLGIVAGAGGTTGTAAIEVRAAQDATSSADAVDALARGNVIAIVGPVHGESVDAAAARAEQLGVVLLSLSTAADQRQTGKFVFHVVHSAEARARALARRAIDHGVTTFAVLSPDNAYGKSVTAAFVDAVGKANGKIVTKVTYPATEKSFTSYAGKLDGTWQAVFVPDNAVRLALIAPALDAAGRKPQPLGTKKVLGGRPILLLATADNLTDRYATDAGRHS